MFKYLSKIITLAIVCITVGTLLSSCFDDPEFAREPRITFNSIIYKPRVGAGLPDSLLLLIDFEDGNGDLGIDTDEQAPPFNQKNYFSNKTGRIFDFQNETLDDLLILADTAVIDTLPSYTNSSFPCLFWDENPQIEVNGQALDTIVYFQPNERHNNIIIKFFVDFNNDGEIDEATEEFDWRTINPGVCNTDYSGRFRVLDPEALDRPAPLEGTITRRMVQLVPFTNYLGDGLIKLKVTMFDREGNRSNTIDTPLFTLDEITAN
ncbi:hypothetical protein FNH22_02025 [Fulvivirga sp. M361]|uniref:hypothetical protein n=1 Tax=Fulvivirga sp. M361 TaxID=2594266 RepID=UPI00117A0AD0|nr:hypothetical protein [Fulvivirga sp. M361]TRX62121.1 hypothetical protein FNH22_02025 [Fulvivirga sp. M361]